MTLICATQLEGFPILIGDYLISTNGQVHGQIPSTDHLDEIPVGEDGTVISHLSQKIFIIRPNLAIGWSGKLFVARSTASYLSETLSQRPNGEELCKALLKYGQEEHKFLAKHPTSLVGAIIYDGKGLCFEWDGERNLVRSDRLIVAGNGSARFSRLLSDIALSKYGSGFRYEGDKYISWALTKIGLMLGEEILHHQNLPDFFGGAFDCVFHDGATFRRIDSLILSFMDIYVLSIGDPQEATISFRATTYWQTYGHESVIERVDTFEDVELEGTVLKAKIKKRSSAIVTNEKSSIVIEKHNYIPFNYCVLFKKAHYKGLEANGCSAFVVPNTEIDVSVDQEYLSLRFSKELYNDSLNDAVKLAKMRDQ